jgi:hypothetical protein
MFWRIVAIYLVVCVTATATAVVITPQPSNHCAKRPWLDMSNGC